MATYLTPDTIREIEIAGKTLRIHQKIIPASYKAPKDVASYVKAGQPLKPCLPLGGDGVPRGITIHNTGDIKTAADTNPAEQYSRATYNGNMGGVVVQYYVHRRNIWQLLDDRERGWHATDGGTRRVNKRGTGQIGGNLDTIAIEAIGADGETTNTTALLTAWLCREYKLDPAWDVYPHKYFYPAKTCPLYILPQWDEFLLAVAFAAAEPVRPPTLPPVDKPAAHWAAMYREYLIKLGIAVDDERYDDPITRGETFALIARGLEKLTGVKIAGDGR